MQWTWVKMHKWNLQNHIGFFETSAFSFPRPEASAVVEELEDLERGWNLVVLSGQEVWNIKTCCNKLFGGGWWRFWFCIAFWQISRRWWTATIPWASLVALWPGWPRASQRCGFGYCSALPSNWPGAIFRWVANCFTVNFSLNWTNCLFEVAICVVVLAWQCFKWRGFPVASMTL